MRRVLNSSLVAGVALVVGGAAAAAQDPAVTPSAAECPEMAGGPAGIELRVGEIVLRAHVTSEVRLDGEGARVDARVSGCELDRSAPADTAAAGIEGAAPSAAASLLRVLHDFRVGLELGTSQDGRCVRASFDVEDATVDLAGTAAAGEPLALELCGLHFRLDAAPASDLDAQP